MRTDYKIGIAVVLFLAGVIIVYNVMKPDATAPTESPPPTKSLAEHGQHPAGEPDSFYTSVQGDGVIESLGKGFTAAISSAADNPEPFRDVRSGSESTVGESAGGNTPDIEMPDSNNTVANTPKKSVEDQIYIVQKGDSGFWTVSEKFYKHGKYWHLIAKANPDADSNALRAGQKLKIPPLPETLNPTGGVALTGRVVEESTGKKYYYVREGDKGFWGVSQKVYKDGKYWARIKKANPNVDSSNLKVGQKLFIPPLSTDKKSPNASKPSRRLLSGQKWYTVQKGDAGFWDVAKKNYGNGKYWKIIAEGNPNVNSGRLRAGQKLIVPPLPQPTVASRTDD